MNVYDIFVQLQTVLIQLKRSDFGEANRRWEGEIIRSFMHGRTARPSIRSFLLWLLQHKRNCGIPVQDMFTTFHDPFANTSNSLPSLPHVDFENGAKMS